MVVYEEVRLRDEWCTKRSDELGLTEPASFPQPRQLHGNPSFLLRLRKSLGEFGLS